MASIMPTRSDSKPKAHGPASLDSSKRWLSKLFYDELSRHEDTGGDLRTRAQVLVEGIVSMATDKEKDDYVRLAASKFIVEHLEGKPQQMQDDRREQMPQLVICVGDPAAVAAASVPMRSVTPEEDSDGADE